MESDQHVSAPPDDEEFDGEEFAAPPTAAGPPPLAMVGVISAVLAPIAAALTLLIFFRFGRVAEPTTADVQSANRLFAAARIVVPMLALFGAVYVFVALRRARRSVLRGLGAALLSLNLLAAAGFGLFVRLRTDIFDHSEHRTCGLRKSMSVVLQLQCTLTATNAPTSTVTLHWKGISDPPGAVFEPGSGTLAPGETTPRISIDAGTQCPIVFILRDQQQGKEIRSPFDGCS
ncbi:hypothetical protein [Dactylosporangium sp. CA-233914]|uniref:hypothetical protein n=1 Tax=Dactylosporangium sp. CA-233914 TaxID=3239934 RepID=UPI003D91545D